MRILLLFLLLGSGFTIINAQHNDLNVLSTAGSDFSIPNFELGWTLGEPIILTLENEFNILSQGFHQPDYQVITSTNTPGWTGKISVTPNPFMSEIKIDINLLSVDRLQLELTDMTGRICWTKSFQQNEIHESIPASDFPAGLYILHMMVPEKNASTQLTIVKI